MKVAIYRVSDGEILRTVVCPPDHVAIQRGDGEDFYLNCSDSATHIVNNEPVTIIPELTLEETRDRKLAELAAARFAAETGGIEIDGAVILTDRESQAQLTYALAALREGFVSSSWWKAADGTWVSLDLTALQRICAAVITHVEACFDKERRLAGLVVAAETKEAVNAITWEFV